MTTATLNSMNAQIQEPSFFDAIEPAQDAIAKWLISEAVLRQEPDIQGGIISWLEEDGSWNGLYPEISGYHLQFLSQVDLPEQLVKPKVEQILSWLSRIGPQGDPFTLRRKITSDWRNQCLFSFDLAIINRGFRAIALKWPNLVPQELWQRYEKSLLSISNKSNGQLRAYAKRGTGQSEEVPEKWSTRFGVHHIKAISAINCIQSDEARKLVSNTLAAFQQPEQSAMRELHPYLYFIEGWLILWGQTGHSGYLDTAATCFEFILKDLDLETGYLPPVHGYREQAARTDVIAQALRAGILLNAAGVLPIERWASAEMILLRVLLPEVQLDGGVVFINSTQQRNAWVSLFTWQALDFLRQARAGQIAPQTCASGII